MLIVYKFKRELPVGLVIRLLFNRLEQFSDAIRGECRLALGTYTVKFELVNPNDGSVYGTCIINDVTVKMSKTKEDASGVRSTAVAKITKY